MFSFAGDYLGLDHFGDVVEFLAGWAGVPRGCAIMAQRSLARGTTPLNRGHAATAKAGRACLGGRPRRLGGTQAGRGTG